MEAIEDNLLRISVIVIALIKFPQYASGFKQTLPSQMLKESDRKTCERFMHQEENKLIKGMKPKAKEKNNKNPITNGRGFYLKKKPLSKKDSIEHQKNDFPLTWAKSSFLVLNLNKVNVALKTEMFTFLKSSSMRISSRSKKLFQNV